MDSNLASLYLKQLSLVMSGLLRDLFRLLPRARNLAPVFGILACVTMALTVHAVDSNSCNNTDFTVRWGQGGFRDSRAEDGKLGGGQFALDLARCGSPFVFTLSSEFYTKGPVPDAKYSYEISNMYTLNLLYTEPLPGFERTDYFLFTGIGQLKVPYQGS